LCRTVADYEVLDSSQA